MLFEEAQEWLFSDESDGIFSFVSVCALLGLDPGYIRRGLEQWQERASAEGEGNSGVPGRCRNASSHKR